MKAITLPRESAERLAKGGDVVIQVGKRIFRKLTILTPLELEKEALDEKYRKDFIELERKHGA